MIRDLSYAKAILEATDQSMQRDEKVYLMGLGVPDPKGIFGTTLDLQEKYGKKRVMDMPVSENAMTGIAIGSAIVGMRPIMTHQRVDFFLLALDQLINNAAKWHYMFGGKFSIPLVIRLIIGRGWGQGPQHSQSLQSLFCQIPGLKVVAPFSPKDAKGMLISAVKDPNPVIFLEHRWLHNIQDKVEEDFYEEEIGKARVIKEGNDITIIASSYMVVESLKALDLLKDEGISIEIIDLRTLRPIDKTTILNSVKKTGRVLIVDGDWKTCGYAAEIQAMVAEEGFHYLKSPPKRITYPDCCCSASWSSSNHFYPTEKDIAVEILKVFQKKTRATHFLKEILNSKMKPLDTPDKSFRGPF
jgi:pyruvate dehydrogenase E1 component beta subunit